MRGWRCFLKQTLGLLALLVTVNTFSFSQTPYPPTPPPYCHPCLFYGGDTDSLNPLSGQVHNRVTLLEQDGSVLVPFRVPAGQTWTITGVFSNNFAATSAAFIE